VVAIIAILGVILTAAYILLTIRRVFFGELPEKLTNISDISWRDKLVIGVLSLVMIAVGIFPSLLTTMIDSGVTSILALLGGA